MTLDQHTRVQIEVKSCHLMVGDTPVDVSNGSLRGICVYMCPRYETIRITGQGLLTNRRHVAENLGSIDTDPVECGVRESVSTMR